MLTNVLLITEPENYDYMENVVKRSLAHFSGSVSTSTTTVISWLEKNYCDFNLIITAVKDDQIKKFNKRAFLIKLLADLKGIEIIQLNKEKVEQNEIQAIVNEKLKR